MHSAFPFLLSLCGKILRRPAIIASTRRVLVCLVPICLVVAATGCSQSKRAQSEKLSENDISLVKRAQQSDYEPLQEQLSRVLKERGTPSDLAQKLPKDAAKLNEVYPASLKALQNRVTQHYPRGAFSFSPKSLAQLRKLVDEHRPRIIEFRKALEAEEISVGVDHKAGMLSDYAYIDAIRTLFKIEAFMAAVALEDSEFHQVVVSTNYLLKTARALSKAQQIVPRILAAQLRGEIAKIVMEVNWRNSTPKELREQLFHLVEGALAYWTADRNAWIGERAQGLHAFELVRGGDLHSLLNEKELKQLKSMNSPYAKKAILILAVDHDETFYLQSIHSLIDACDLPYYKRAETFNEINRQLNAQLDEKFYPFLTDKVLLDDFETAQRWQAEDRAIFEALAIALAFSLGETEQDYSTNPLTGKPYQRTLSNGELVFSDLTLGGNPFKVVSRSRGK